MKRLAPPFDDYAVDEEGVADNQQLAIADRAEIDVQISTAKRFPRVVSQALERALALATMNADIAGRCGYAIPRKDKNGKQVWIKGPSVRLAEIIASTWGNIRIGSRIKEITAERVVCQGVCFDTETNVYRTMEVATKITTKDGRTFSEDMITNVINSTSAKASRNAVFGVVPRVYIDAIYEKAMAVALGTQRTIAERRQALLAYWAKQGIDEEKLLAFLGKRAVDDIDLEDLDNMHGLAEGVKSGEVSIDVFETCAQEAPDAAFTKEQLSERKATAKELLDQIAAELPKRGCKGKEAAAWLNKQAASYRCKSFKDLTPEQLDVILNVTLDKEFPQAATSTASPMPDKRSEAIAAIRAELDKAGTSEAAAIQACGLIGDIDALNYEQLRALYDSLTA